MLRPDEEIHKMLYSAEQAEQRKRWNVVVINQILLKRDISRHCIKELRGNETFNTTPRFYCDNKLILVNQDVECVIISKLPNGSFKLTVKLQGRPPMLLDSLYGSMPSAVMQAVMFSGMRIDSAPVIKIHYGERYTKLPLIYDRNKQLLTKHGIVVPSVVDIKDEVLDILVHSRWTPPEVEPEPIFTDADADALIKGFVDRVDAFLSEHLI